MLTKRQIIEAAFGELALAGYAFDITPEEQQAALLRLDLMMADWENRGIRLGYNFAGQDMDASSGIPDHAGEAVLLHLAIRLASGVGKLLTSDQRRSARESFAPLLRGAAMPQTQQLPAGMPLGAGNARPYYPRAAGGRFTGEPDRSPLQTTQGGDLSILPE
jgi:hypothetical protein